MLQIIAMNSIGCDDDGGECVRMQCVTRSILSLKRGGKLVFVVLCMVLLWDGSADLCAIVSRRGSQKKQRN